MDLKLFFRKNLLHWNTNNNKREMPWKGEKNPYKIWLSEIILQQTRVEQGWIYYEKFISTYPDIFKLASAKDDDVFKLWEGLGYYSRCKNLLATARIIADKNVGVFPTKYDDILALKGIGPYTAAAISSFAYNLPYAVVDGNVYRVLSRFFGIETPTDSTEGKKLFTTLANECIDKNKAGNYNQAIMDFGATVCTPALPVCTSCVLYQKCVAFIQQKQQLLPVKEKLLKKKTRYFNYFIIEHNGSYLLRKRTGKDIWQNLHDFYLSESIENIAWTNSSIKKLLKNQLEVDAEIIRKSGIFTQILTHQTILANFIQVKVRGMTILPENHFWVDQKEMRKLAFPRVINQYLDTPFLQIKLF